MEKPFLFVIGGLTNGCALLRKTLPWNGLKNASHHHSITAAPQVRPAPKTISMTKSRVLKQSNITLIRSPSRFVFVSWALQVFLRFCLTTGE
jgi:hypothetical protein